MPGPHATHSSLIPSRYVKHATLINNCYPSRPDEKGPKSSDLSYLVFYATSKPAKLTKVGNYIERRTVRDFRKKKLSDVHCSLEIIKTLIMSSKAHLNIFSKNIVSILDALLVDISDLDIVRHCQNVFSCFCGAHDGSTVGVDLEFRTVYDRVVTRFAGIAVLKGGDNSNRYRMIGLRALESVVSSSALYACDTKAQLGLVLPTILDSLIDSKTGVSVALDASPEVISTLRRSISIQVAVHPDNVVSDEDVTAEGIRCLRALFKTPNGGNIRLALGLSFTYLDEHAQWWPSTLAIGIIMAIVSVIIPQYRFMVVNEITARIDSVESTTLDLTLRLQKRATLISALEAILVSPVSLIGIPVLEVLHALLVALTKSLSAASSMVKEGESGRLLSLTSVIQDGLVKSIGGLATHIYYSNQVPHIISHIAGKLSFKLGVIPQPSTILDVPTVDYRAALLRCMLAVIKTSKDSGRQEASFHAAEISSDLLTPCLGLLMDDNAVIRTTFAQALITFLVTKDDERDNAGSALMTSRIPSTSGDLHFRVAAHQTLYRYALSANFSPKDLAVFYGILKALFDHFQDDEFIRVVPMLFSLQDWCQTAEGPQEDILLVTRKRAVAAAIVSYFQMAVATYSMAEPQEYLENIKRSRESELQWIPVQYGSIEETLARAEELTWDAPTEPLTPTLTHPLAREHLVTLLTTVSDRFRAGADRFGVTYNVESQSGVTPGQGHQGREFGSGLFLSSSTLHEGAGSIRVHKAERSVDSRIRVSRHLEDWALPKIVALQAGSSSDLSATEEASESSSLTREGSEISGLQSLSEGSPMMSKKIGVDSLKAALAAAQMVAVDATSDAGSSSASSEIQNGTVGLATGTQRLSPVSIHVQTLRKQPYHQHIGGASTVSTASNLTLRPDLAELLSTIQVEGAGGSESRLVPPYM
ncbi:plasma membrane localization protein [Dissophora globulifera]|uniref:Plasma membrane localization protein n=1 Tax=Dissophora globulifera TaxID=979702 RepID=A0A9P6R9C9_9FUNG|nr:plasma membrane localization protein [Dissophora globulifera]